MSSELLGERFDIHGGGIDLLFPHHENERAQSSRAFRKHHEMAKYWMHNGFLQVEGEKMAKSEGNFVTIRELREGWHGRKWDQSELRLMMLSTHYSQPIDWTLRGLEEAGRISSEWKQLTANVDHDRIEIVPSEQLLSALCDDLNTHAAILSLHETARRAAKDRSFSDQLYADLVFFGLFSDRKEETSEGVEKIKRELHNRAELFANPAIVEASIKSFVSSIEPTANTTTLSSAIASNFQAFQYGSRPAFLDEWTKYGPPFISSSDIGHIEGAIGIRSLNDQIEQRVAARRVKDFQTSDRIRNELSSKGIELGDKKDGTPVWKVKP
jgi:cysteinyl-tRNA synthetase